MNTHNDWENLLRIFNKDLERTGYSVKIINFNNDGYYICEILKDGVSYEVYAENYYEDELSSLITDAHHYILTTLAR